MDLILFAVYFLGLYFGIFFLFHLMFDREEDVESLVESWPTVTVAVPAYNEQDTIAATIRSVLELEYPREKLRIFAVDDGSRDATLDRIREVCDDHPGRVEILSHENIGKARSLNHALFKSDSEYFVCLDADSTVDPGTLMRMIAYFERQDADVAVVTPEMRVRAPRTIIERMQSIEYFMAIALGRILTRLDATYVAPGPFSVYRSRLLKTVGGFDPSSLVEDQEIGWRYRTRGYHLKQCPQAYVHTKAPETLGQLYRQRNRWYKGGMLNLFRYRSALFNRTHGHFGKFQAPFILFSFVSGIFASVYLGTVFVTEAWTRLRSLRAIDFDIITLLRTMEFSIDFLTFDVLLASLSIAILALGIGIVIISMRNIREQFNTRNAVAIAGYVLAYYLIIGSIVAISAGQILVRRVQKW